MRVILANDTKSYHAGSEAVMAMLRSGLNRQGHRIVGTVHHRNFRKKLEEAGEADAEGEADALVVNGEGTLHHCKPDFWLFEALILAQARGLRTYLLNTVWDANAGDPKIRAMLRKLDGLEVREPISARALRDLEPKLDPPVRGDLSWYTPINEQADHVDFGGAEVRGDWFTKRGVDEAKLAEFFPKALTLIPKNLSWSGTVKSLRTASLYVTGRHHGVYAACKARTPFVAYAHNCHKIRGLFDWAGVSIPIPKNWKEILLARDWARQHRAVYRQLFDFLESRPPWTGLSESG